MIPKIRALSLPSIELEDKLNYNGRGLAGFKMLYPLLTSEVVHTVLVPLCMWGKGMMPFLFFFFFFFSGMGFHHFHGADFKLLASF